MMVEQFWRTVPLANVTRVHFGGGTPSTKHPTYWDGNIPWTTTAVIGEDDLYLGCFQRGITQEGLQNSSSRIAPAGSLLVGTRVGVGKAVVATFDVAVNQDISVLIPNDDVMPEFLAYLFKSSAVKSYLTGRKRGTTIKGIPRTNLLEMEVVLPPLPEQREITRALQAVQVAIETRRRELELERERKAALMDYLFTYGTRNEPTKQTEIGEMPSNWVVAKMNDIVDIQYGYRTSIPSSPPQNGVPIISTAEIRNDGHLDLSRIRTVEIPDRFIDTFSIQKNDILFNWRNSQQHVGKTAIVDFVTEQPTIFASFILRLRVKELVNHHFLHFMLHYYRNEGVFFRLSRRAVNQANYNASELAELKVPLPPMPEQVDITDLLDKFDVRIAMLERESAVLNELFKAMLDELMTGRLSAIPLVEGEGNDD